MPSCDIWKLQLIIMTNSQLTKLNICKSNPPYHCHEFSVWVWHHGACANCSVISGPRCSTAGFPSQWFLSPVQSHWAQSFVSDTKPLSLAATTAFVVTFSDRPPPRAVLVPPPPPLPRPPLPPRAPPRPRPGRPRSPKLISSWDVMSLAGLRKWWSADSSGLACW